VAHVAVRLQLAALVSVSILPGQGISGPFIGVDPGPGAFDGYGRENELNSNVDTPQNSNVDAM
jgi:hypothetical protein